MTNYEIFRLLFPRFLERRQNDRGIVYTHETVEAFKCTMGSFFKWIDSIGMKMVDVQKKDVIEYKKLAGKARSAGSTFIMKIKLLENFYDELLSSGIVKENPFSKIILKKHDPGNRYTMTYDEIKLYRTLKIDIRMVAAFEVFISSGMRLSDLCNIRCCDVYVGKKVFDKIDGCNSKYIGAAILIDPRLIRTKNRKKRVTYISAYALKMLKLYMDVMGLNFKSNSPLFPWATDTFRAYFSEIGIEFKKIRDAFYSNEKIADSRSLKVNPELMIGEPFTGEGINKRLVNRIKTRIKNIQRSNKRDDVLIDDTHEMNNLHIHAFRYTFTSLMYHRDWAGGRKDAVYISQLLGHRHHSQTMTYLTTVNTVNDDTEWKLIWLGSPNDWRNAVIKKNDYGGWGMHRKMNKDRASRYGSG